MGKQARLTQQKKILVKTNNTIPKIVNIDEKIVTSLTLKKYIELNDLQSFLTEFYKSNIDYFTKDQFEITELFLTNCSSYEHRKEFLSTLISKINLQKNITSEVRLLQAKCFETLASDLLKQINLNSTSELIIHYYKKILDKLEKALFLYVNNTSKEGAESVMALIEGVLSAKLPLEGLYDLTIYSLDLRKQNFAESAIKANTILITSMLHVAEKGVGLNKIEHVINGLKHADSAYNLSCQLKNHQTIAKSLKFMSIGYKKIGDETKATIFDNQATYITKAYINKEKIDGLEYNIIPKKTVVLEKEIAIKQLIQKDILDWVMKQSAAAKWHDVKILQYGVSGYIDKDFIIKKLGQSYSEENYKIALQLCFEAITLGIMTSSDQNPLCAAIFCIKYPEITKEILDNHPEYFIDINILKLVDKIEEHSELIIGSKIITNPQYNEYFASKINPFVEKRITDYVLQPIKHIIAKGEWSNKISENMKSYLTNDYLNKILGNNLSQIPDVFNISRILAFKVIESGINTLNSKNFAPIDVFIKTYQELNKRIEKEYPQYFTKKNLEQHDSLLLSLIIPQNHLPKDDKIKSELSGVTNEESANIE